MINPAFFVTAKYSNVLAFVVRFISLWLGKPGGLIHKMLLIVGAGAKAIKRNKILEGTFEFFQTTMSSLWFQFTHDPMDATYCKAHMVKNTEEDLE